jgi:outer membrane protein assembly factor BamB
MVLMATMAPGPAIAQKPAHTATRDPAEMPTAWLQLGAGTDNAGRRPGTLDVSWHFKAPRPVRGLSVAGGLVVVGTESPDASELVRGPDQHGFLIALDAFTGAQVWMRKVPSWIHGDPVIFDGRAFATYGQYPMQAAGGVTAVDVATGDSLWSMPIADGVMPSAALDSATGSLVVVGGDGILRTLDYKTGAVRNQAGLRAADAMASPRIDDDGVVYVGAQSSLFSYSTRTDRFNWTYRSPTLVELGTPPPALTDSIVFTEGTERLSVWSAFRELSFGRFLKMGREAYTLSGNRLSTYSSWYKRQWLLAIDRRDGHLRWQQPLGAGRIILRNNSGTPVVTGDRVIISSPVGRTVSAFDVSSGKPLWTHSLDAIHVGAVTVVDNDLVLGDRAGTITLLRASNGTVLGTCHAGARFSPTAPIVVGHTLFAAMRDGQVYATPYDSLRRRATQPQPTNCF